MESSNNNDEPNNEYYKNLVLFWTDIFHLMSSKPQALASICPMRSFVANSKKVATELVEMNDDLVEFNKYLTTYYSQLSDTWHDAQNKVNAKTSDIRYDAEHADSIKRIWIDIFDNDFTELFDSTKFAENYGNLVSKELELVKHWDNITNTILQAANLPSKEALDEVYKEIHLLKKRIHTSEIELLRQRHKSGTGINNNRADERTSDKPTSFNLTDKDASHDIKKPDDINNTNTNKNHTQENESSKRNNTLYKKYNVSLNNAKHTDLQKPQSDDMRQKPTAMYSGNGSKPTTNDTPNKSPPETRKKSRRGKRRRPKNNKTDQTYDASSARQPTAQNQKIPPDSHNNTPVKKQKRRRRRKSKNNIQNENNNTNFKKYSHKNNNDHTVHETNNSHHHNNNNNPNTKHNSKHNNPRKSNPQKRD